MFSIVLTPFTHFSTIKWGIPNWVPWQNLLAILNVREWKDVFWAFVIFYRKEIKTRPPTPNVLKSSDTKLKILLRGLYSGLVYQVTKRYPPEVWHAVVTSRSLKWHLVPFRDFWSENSEKWSLFCLKSPFSNDLVPFSKFWVAKKQNWHFSHRYANYWFWFCWSVYLGIHFQLLCSFFGPFFEKLWSLFGPFFENLWSLFGPF